MTLTQALAHSLNTVSVRLTLEFGPAAVAKTAYRLGISSKLDANPSLALGTSEVSLIELVSAYAPFANGGDAVAAHVIERVRTRPARCLFARVPHSYGRIVEARYVAMMNAMMRETLLHGTAQRAQLPGWQAAGKTGTSQDFRDAWFIGYTGHLSPASGSATTIPPPRRKRPAAASRWRSGHGDESRPSGRGGRGAARTRRLAADRCSSDRIDR